MICTEFGLLEKKFFKFNQLKAFLFHQKNIRRNDLISDL